MSSGNFSTSTAKTLQLQKSTENDATASGLEMTRRCVFLGRHGFEGIWEHEDRRVPRGQIVSCFLAGNFPMKVCRSEGSVGRN